MKNLKITKVLLSLFLVLGLATSSFAIGPKNDIKHNNKVKVEQKVKKEDFKHFSKMQQPRKQEIKVVNVYNNYPKKYKHHKHYVKRSYVNSKDLAVACIGAGVCLAVISAINS